MATEGSKEQSAENNEGLESTAELPVLKDEVQPQSAEEPQPSKASTQPADQTEILDESLEDTADLSDLFAQEDTSELPLVQSFEGEEDPTAELPVLDGSSEEAAVESGSSEQAGSASGAEDEESTEFLVPDKGETSEVVSAATLERDARKKRVRRVAKIAVVLAVVAVCYGGGVAYYSSHFFPRTSVNGIDASNATTEEVASSLASSGQGYGLSVSGLGFELQLGADEVGYELDGTSMAQAARDQEQAVAWPIALFQSHELSVSPEASYDDQGLTQAIDDAIQSYNSSNMNTSRAYVGYDYSTREYKVSGSVSGTALSAQEVHDACAQAISNNQTEVVLTDDMVRDATLDDCLELKKVVDIANTDCNATISITVNGEEKWSLSEELRGWVTVSHSKLMVSQNGIRTWATYYLAPQVAYTNDEGSHTLDVGSMVTTLMDHLEAGDTSAIEAPMTVTSR